MNEGGPVLSGGKVQYELAGKTTALSHGGIGANQRLVKKTGLASTSTTTFICSRSSSASAFCSASAFTAPTPRAFAKTLAKCEANEGVVASAA
ncbi:MAG: hypothetical protein IPK13_14920 [Deltaproteobacteria bacterium]|nr:hypothetical protein [Deltaproteobacteria bacterium]